MIERITRLFTGETQKEIDEIYLLVHPFYDSKTGKYDIALFRKIWRQSIENAGTKPNVFGIMYFPGDG
jgi:beta-N-acetylglucosaminidase